MSLVGLVGLPGVLWWLQTLLWTQTDWRALIAEPLTVATVLYLMVGFGWAGWLWLLTATAHDVTASLRHKPVRPRLPASLGGLAGSLAGLVAVLGQPSLAAANATLTAPPVVAGPDPTGSGHPTPTDTTAGHTTSPAAAAPALTPTSTATVMPGAAQVSYQVRRGDWLGVIADRYLGDFDRYPDLQRLNPGRIPDSTGRRGPDHIEAGWRLILPADAVDRGPRRHATGTSDPDAVAPSAPATTAEPAPSAPSSVATPTPTGPNQSAQADASTSPKPGSEPLGHADHDWGVGVPLPGGWISLPFAAALAGAAAMVWLRRRHRYVATPGTTTSSDNPDDPNLRPLPPVLNRIRRAARQQRPEPLNPPASPPPTVAEYNAASADQRPELPPVGPSGPHLAGVGERIPPSGLGLVGPGAEPALRALLAATLSSGTPADPDAEGQVIAPADALSTLLGADAVHASEIPRLQVTTNLSEALIRADELLIERRRLLHEYDVADLAELRAADPYHPPLPPVLLLAETPPSQLQPRLTTTLQLGASLQISAVLLGEWPHGDTLTVGTDGHTSGSDGDRLAVLDIPATRQLLDVLREAHTGQPSPAPPLSPSASNIDPATPEPATADPESPQSPVTPPHAAPSATTTVGSRDDTTSPDVPAATQPGTCTGETRTDPEPAQTPSPVAPATGTTAAVPEPRRAVRIRLLGEPTILDRDGNPVTGLRHHARELLVYLAVHRSGAKLSDIMEAFWPTATVRRAGERLSTEAGDLRRRIRQAAADKTIQPVINTGGRYHLDPNLVDLDVWHLIDVLRQASTTTDPSSRATLLRQAIDAHTGPLAQGHDYDWIEQPREQLRRHGIRARLSLAEIVATDDPRGAAELVQGAAALDPINEDLARQAMRASARLGDAAAVRGVLQRLHAALNDIDEQPSPDTTTLAAQLQHDIATNSGVPDDEPDADAPNP
nr:hypothetical protein GCM10020063_009550 [Dactylosporangium thailandense]